MKFTRSDAAITAAVLALSSVLFFFFLRDVNALSSGAAADALGSIEFRKNTATRKAADSMRWERLRDKATVYRGDTIRTAELSEAGIKFDDGTQLDVFENSMLRLDVSDEGQTFELSGGAMHIAGGEGGTGGGANRVIKIGDSVVSVPADADVSMLSGGGVVSLDVAGGAVSVTSASGAKTSVGENEELRLDTKSGALEVVRRSVVPVSPAQGARFAFTGIDGKVSFSARASGPVESISLEFSADSAFSAPSSRVPLARGDGDSFAVETPVASGVWYWRVVSGTGEVSAARRITVVSTSAPSPVWPEDGAVIGFRKEVPNVRFSWSESSGAEAYTLELRRVPGAGTSSGADAAASGAAVDVSGAPERTVRTKLTAITLSSLAEGYWTWRVVPEYPASFVASPVPSASRRFSVLPSDEMRPVALLSPAGESPVEKGASVAFSWGANAEAARYELRLYAKSDSPSPVASFSSDRSWMTLDGTRAPVLAQDGAKYWGVAWFDADGNESPSSERRRIVVVDARAAIVQLFPPDGYAVAESLAQAVRFAWKGADAPGLSFQLSRDASFAAIERTIPVSGNSLLGLSLARGEWFWRVRIPNPDGSAFFESEARSFSVVAPFAAPVLKNPKPGSSVTVLEGKSVPFEIGIADGALKGSLIGSTRYSCKLYRADADSPSAGAPDADALAAEKPAFSAENLEPTGTLSVSCSVPLGSMPEGAYRVVLRAYAPDAPGNTAIVGYLGEETLFVGKIVPVEFSAPKKNSVIDGVSARRSGVTIRWKSEFAPDSLRVELSRDGSRYPLDFAWKPGVSSLRLESLPPGAYSVAISAKIGTFDVSPPAPLRFTVAEIPRLSAPVLTAPEDKAVFDQDYLSTRGEIAFQWKPVKGATDYAFRIISDGTGKEVFRRERLTANTLTLNDLTCLDKGKFTWEVVAGNYAADGTVDQIGKASSARFTVSLPDLSLPKGAKDAEYYGY
jgi:hypothetical protein